MCVVGLLAACSATPLGGGTDPDGGAAGDSATNAGSDLSVGPHPDLPAFVDLAMATCASVSTRVQGYLDSHAACQQDSECAVVNTRCGLPGQCGAYLQQSALDGLNLLQQEWDSMRCMGPCPPCAFPSPAACVKGRCAALGFNDRPVGSPCFDKSQCHNEGQYLGSCVNGAQFKNGYCTLPCAHGWGCPQPGMSCRPAPGGATPDACYKQCMVNADCRGNDGYLCCPSWSMLGGPGDVCYPGPCPK